MKLAPYLSIFVYQCVPKFPINIPSTVRRALWNSITIYSTSQMIIAKIPKCCIFLLKTQHHIPVKAFYIRPGIRSKLSIVVPCTIRRVLSSGILNSSIRQTKIFETVDVALRRTIKTLA